MAKDEKYDLHPLGRSDEEATYWLDELADAGFTVAQAEKLIGCVELSLHDVLEMVGRGCSPELAFDISI